MLSPTNPLSNHTAGHQQHITFGGNIASTFEKRSKQLSQGGHHNRHSSGDYGDIINNTNQTLVNNNSLTLTHTSRSKMDTSVNRSSAAKGIKSKSKLKQQLEPKCLEYGKNGLVFENRRTS